MCGVGSGGTGCPGTQAAWGQPGRVQRAGGQCPGQRRLGPLRAARGEGRRGDVGRAAWLEAASCVLSCPPFTSSRQSTGDRLVCPQAQGTLGGRPVCVQGGS